MNYKDPLFSELLAETLPNEEVTPDFTKNVMSLVENQSNFEIQPLISRRAWTITLVLFTAILFLSLILSIQLPPANFDFSIQEVVSIFMNHVIYIAILGIAVIFIVIDEIWRKKNLSRSL